MEILIADDSEMIRESLKKLLAPIKGVDKINEAEDVPHAIERVRKLHPDMLILDIKMPGGNGFDVLEAAKKIKDAPLVVMLTNFPNEQFKKKSFELGADYFFDKSTEFSKILAVCDIESRKLNS